MRFLVKHPGGAVAASGLRYRTGGHHEKLLQMLLAEQRGFCAYTEKRADPLDTVAIEHFLPDLKDTDADGYHNWYVVLQTVNQWKRRREKQHAGASFFTTRFFQHPVGNARVEYVVADGMFAPVRDDDAEAWALIDYLGFNEEPLFTMRRNHVATIRALGEDAGWSPERLRDWLLDHPRFLDFVTALEAELAVVLLP